MKISTRLTKARAILVFCLLMTLIFLAMFYFSEDSVKPHFLTDIFRMSPAEQRITHWASEGNPNSFTERNMINVSKWAIKSSTGPPERTVLTNLTVVESRTSTRNTEKFSVTEFLHAVQTGLEREPVPGERHIIFLETSCVLNDSVTGKQSGLAISPRAACAVASAANTNPDNKIYLLYTCSINGNLEDSPEYVKQMLSYPNVRIWKLVISDYIKGTPLENWKFMEKVRSSSWPVVHASDMLRYISLWKYGGTYLDTDFVIKKSLDEIGTNYAGMDSQSGVANGALNFDMEYAGRRAIDLILKDVQSNFNGQAWAGIGPLAVTRVFRIMCGTEHVSNTTREKCSGIAVLPTSVFYSIYYSSWRLFFEASRSDEVLKKVEGSYGVHVWNKMSSEEKITVGSRQAYGLLAEKYCPQVYWNCGPVF